MKTSSSVRDSQRREGREGYTQQDGRVEGHDPLMQSGVADSDGERWILVLRKTNDTSNLLEAFSLFQGQHAEPLADGSVPEPVHGCLKVTEIPPGPLSMLMMSCCVDDVMLCR